ncbi:MAG: NAD-dependent DNA ligase LigA, partial [Paramuribaculum sp.]|nr:NAD-dependent DNA ligase LigA [Paramuribaculum sp.]
KRASLHNADIIRNLDIHDGDYLYVEIGGEIIPKITGVDLGARKPGRKEGEFVRNCPACGTPLVRVEGEAAWMCPNKYGCAPQIIGRVEHFVGRRMMNIDGIGEETSEVLFSEGLVSNIADLYSLTREKLVALDRFGERSAERILDSLEESKAVPFERVIFALSIPYVGETVAKKLARACRNIDNIISMPQEELTAIDDIGPRIARSIKEYFAAPLNIEIVQRLKAAGLRMAMDESESEQTSDKLAGRTFVISGVFVHHSRDEYKALIEVNGGKNSGSISKKTDFVLAGANMGPAKLEKATKLGVPVIDEDTFLGMISNS